MRARRAREVVEAEAKHDRASSPPSRAHPSRHAVDERDERRVDLLRRRRRAAERPLGPDRPASAASAHPSRVPVVREGVEMAPGRATEHRHERRLLEAGDLADGHEPLGVEPLGGDAPDTPEPLDGQRMEEVELGLRRHDEKPVGLGNAARHLGQELRPRHPDGDREADLLEDRAPQPRRDLGWRAGNALEASHVEERLVDGQSLDERRGVLEHAVDRLAGFRVDRHARRNDDRVGAEPARLPSAHRREDAVRLRLVARREHDASADDHGPPAQARVVPLLDRREERVEIGVEDGRLA